MSTVLEKVNGIDITSLNKDIELFDAVHPITEDMKLTHSGVSRLVMLDRYAYKDTEKVTLKVGDFVVLTVKSDPKFPARGLGFVQAIDWEANEVKVKVLDEFLSALDNEDEVKTGIITRSLDVIDKPLEIFYEQIAKRNATGLSVVEKSEEKQMESFDEFYNELASLNFVPAGRVSLRCWGKYRGNLFQLLCDALCKGFKRGYL